MVRVASVKSSSSDLAETNCQFWQSRVIQRALRVLRHSQGPNHHHLAEEVTIAESILPLFPADYPDDSQFVRSAMHILGFICEFADLTPGQMQMALSIAQDLKRTQRQPEIWES